jgi:arylformamidase
MNPELADLQYNPRLRVADFAQFFSQWRRRSEQTRAELTWRELAYGCAESERLDFFPAARPHAPLLIFLHGGYWRALDKRDFSWVAPPFVAAGAAAAIINYGLAPATPIESIVSQVGNAVSWLASQADALGINGRIVAAGHSAGAHLAAMLLVVPSAVHAAVTLSGIFDLRPLVNAPFLGADLQLSPERAASLSPLLRSPAGPRPLVLAVGETESDEFHRQSEALKSAWSRRPGGSCAAAGPTIGPIRVPGRHHFSICDALVDPLDPLFQATSHLLELPERI